MAEWEDELDRRLAASKPLRDGIVHNEASLSTLDEIRLRARGGDREVNARAAAVNRAGTRLSRLRPATRRGAIAVSAVGVLALGGVATAATAVISTYTGTTVPAASVGAFGPGENLRIGGAGYCTAFNAATAGVPYPAGYGTSWRDWALLSTGQSPTTLQQLCDSTTPETVDNDGTAQDVEISTGGAKMTIVRSAFCAWTADWITAENADDSATAATDAAQIAGALQWPDAQIVDPDPSVTVTNGEITTSALGWFTAVQREVAAGDVAQAKEAFDANATAAEGPAGGACNDWIPPVNSDNGTVMSAATQAPTALNGSDG